MIVSILKMLQCFIFEYLQIVPREGTCFIVHSRGTTFRYNCIFEIFNFLICCIFSILEMLFSFSFYLYLVKAKGDTTARDMLLAFPCCTKCSTHLEFRSPHVPDRFELLKDATPVTNTKN